jgi:hypothetical protein
MQENPLQRPPVWKGGFQQTSEVVRSWTKEIPNPNNPNGATILVTEGVVNSAGDPFDPPPTVEVSRPLVHVTVNRAMLDLTKIIDLQDAVNSKPWFQINPRCARCVSIEWASKFENNTFFWEITYGFALKNDTWDQRVLDAGWRVKRLVLDENGNSVFKLVHIADIYGEPPTAPVPLNGFGAEAAIGDPPTYLVRRVFRERDFNDLVV